MSALTDPCLPESWNVYGAYAGLFAMLAILGMQLLEFLAHQRYRSMQAAQARLTKDADATDYIQDEEAHVKGDESTYKEKTINEIDKSVRGKHVHYHEEKPEQGKRVNSQVDHIEQINNRTEETENGGTIIDTNGKSNKKRLSNGEMNHVENKEQINNQTEEPEQLQQTTDRTEQPKKKKHSYSISKKFENLQHAHDHTEVPEEEQHNREHHRHQYPRESVVVEILHINSSLVPIDHTEGSGGHHHGGILEDNSQQNKISTYLLELGIALHSVLIGLTLGTTNDAFVGLFIALCFHQFFEAIALGAQIANLKTATLKSAVSMVIFYSLTTPVGIAIGIGIHSGTYNPKSVASLLSSGILDSLAAGVLIYVAIVNLITAEMGANAHAFYSLSSRLKLLYFTALYLGATAMAIIGRWA
jgi:zinc transporter ZupT